MSKAGEYQDQVRFRPNLEIDWHMSMVVRHRNASSSAFVHPRDFEVLAASSALFIII
jgi:hypothetical protein